MPRKSILSHEQLLKVFEKQAKYLIDNDCDLLAGDDKGVFLKGLEMAGEALRKLEYLSFRAGNIPLLVIISRRMIGIQKQIESIMIANHPGKLEIAAHRKYKEPQKPVYVIFDVNVGSDLGRKSASDAKIILRMDGRAGLLIEEGIALARHYPQLLSDKGWYLVASMRDDPPAVPTIVLDNDEGGVCLTLTCGTARRHYETPSRGTEFDL